MGGNLAQSRRSTTMPVRFRNNSGTWESNCTACRSSEKHQDTPSSQFPKATQPNRQSHHLHHRQLQLPLPRTAKLRRLTKASRGEFVHPPLLHQFHLWVSTSSQQPANNLRKHGCFSDSQESKQPQRGVPHSQLWGPYHKHWESDPSKQPQSPQWEGFSQ